MVYTSNNHHAAMKKKCNTPFSQIVAEHGCKECSNSSYFAPCYCTQNPNSGKVRFLWKLNTVLLKECNPMYNKLHVSSCNQRRRLCSLALSTMKGCVAQGMQPYVQQTFTLELFQPKKAVLHYNDSKTVYPTWGNTTSQYLVAGL